MNAHQLHAVIAGSGGIGLSFELFKRAGESAAKQIRLAVLQLVEAFPEPVDVGAAGCVHAVCAAQAQPDLFEPGAKGGCRLRGAKVRRCFDRLEHSFRRFAALLAEQVETGAEQFRNGPAKNLRVVGAREPVKIGQREPAPRRAQHAQPRDPVFTIEQSACKGERIEDFGPVVE